MQFDLSGEPVHTRCLSVSLTQGQGASIDFRADIIDLRKAGLMELAGRIATAGIIHKMELRGAYSPDTDRIEQIEWDQSHVMHEANRATKGECCRDPMVRLKELVGTRLGDAFASELKQCFGGPLGCTHVSTLFHELSAFASRLRVIRTEHPELSVTHAPAERIASRALFFDAFLPDGRATAAINVRLTDNHFGELQENGSESLLSHEEVRLVAEVELAGWQLRGLGAKERCRQGPTFGEAPWRDRTEELGEFAGQSLGGGMARLCLERLGQRDDDARLRSTMLNLAPGMTQVGVALSDSLVPSTRARPDGSGLAGPGPCYMLRAEGPLMQNLGSWNGGDPIGEGG